MDGGARRAAVHGVAGLAATEHTRTGDTFSCHARAGLPIQWVEARAAATHPTLTTVR